MAFSDYDRLMWEVLAHTSHRLGLEAPWFEAKKIAPEDEGVQANLVSASAPETADDDRDKHPDNNAPHPWHPSTGWRVDNWFSGIPRESCVKKRPRQ